jgi:NAD(P)-dependent dehydrogenase (short-subunit alcohol dehydrogenase family)
MSNLSGKTALVTGASRGIGRASALALAKGGCPGARPLQLRGNGRDGRGGRNPQSWRESQKVVGRLSCIRRAARVRAVVGARLDVLVASASIAKAGTIEETTLEDFDALFAVNVRPPYFLVQQLLPVMCKGSSVVLLSSLAAHTAIGALSAYAATKGATDTLVKHFAAALGERGIRVNAVTPGVVPTDMSSFGKTDQNGNSRWAYKR